MLIRLKQHLIDQTNAHVSGSPTAGQVPTYQGSGQTAWATPPGSAGGSPVGSAVPLAPSGTGGPGTSASSSRQDHQHPAGLLSPSRRGFKGLPTDVPQNAWNASTSPTSGTIYVQRVTLDANGTLGTVRVPLTTAGSGLSSCFAGIYDPTSLAQLAVSTDQSASWATAGTKATAMAAATGYLAAGQDVHVAFLYVGTSFALRSAPSANQINDGITCCATAGTGQTALPATLTALTVSATPLYFATL